MTTPLEGYEYHIGGGVSFTLDLNLDVQSLLVESLSIEEIAWWFNETGHPVQMPVGTDLKVLKAEILESLNRSEFHREEIAEKHRLRIEDLKAAQEEDWP